MQEVKALYYYLQRGARGVVGVGQDLYRLLEHDPEGGVGAVRGEGDLVGAEHAA